MAYMIGSPAISWAQDAKPTPAAITRHDAQKAQRWIVQGDPSKAIAWLDSHLEGQKWCEDAAGIEGFSPTQLAQFRADLGVLARRTKRYAQATRCLEYALDRPGSEHRAAALFEAYLTLPHLDAGERKSWSKKWTLRGYGTYWKYADNCIKNARGPIRPRLACALARASAEKWSSTELRNHIQPLVYYAARLAPKSVYLTRLSATQKRQLVAYAKSSPLSVVRGRRVADDSVAQKYMLAHFNHTPDHASTPGSPLEPCSKYPAPNDRERLPDLGCYDFSVSKKTAQKLSSGNVQLMIATGGPVLAEHFRSAYHGCHNISRPYLLAKTAGKPGFLDLGVFSGGDNCYVSASQMSTFLRATDPKQNTFGVRVDTQSASVTSHMDPRPISVTQKNFTCQLGTKPTSLVCIKETRSNQLYSKSLYSLAPKLGLKKGKITLRKRPGNYYHPEFDALKGLTPAEAARALPGIEKQIAARVDKSLKPATKSTPDD